MSTKEHPCKDGLTEECFRDYPEWAKKMFAYRLLLTLCPHEITKRLPQLKGLFPLLVPPDWPTSDPWVPGYSIDPAAVFPPDWTPEDPLPDGVTLDPGTVFPPGWTAGDPLPAGVTISPGAVFPPGWTAGDSLPAGVSAGVGQRPEVLGSGAIQPMYVGVFEPGPAHWPASQEPTEPEVPWFYEPFDSGIGVFTEYISGGGTTGNVSGRCKLWVPAGAGYSSIYYDGFTENFPVNFKLSFDLEIISGTFLIYVEVKTGVHRLYYSFYAPTEVYFMIEGDNEYWNMSSFVDTEINWRTDVNGDRGDFYRGSSLVKANMDLRNDAGAPYVYIRASPVGAPGADTEVYIDNFEVVKI